MSFANTLALNNAAVALLRNRQSEDAIQIFEAAWESLRVTLPSQADLEISMYQSHLSSNGGDVASSRQPQHVQNRRSTLCEQPCSPSCPHSNRASVLFSVNMEDAALVTLADDKDLKASPSNFFSVYKRAIAFESPGDDSDIWWTVRCFHCLPSVLLYNAGLVFHLQAVRDGSTANFRRALEFYTLSSFFLRSVCKSEVSVVEIDLLTLAVTNNMGHCQSHFNSAEESRACFENMAEIINQSDSTILLTNAEYFFFHIHILLGSCWTPVLAPAA